MLCKMFLRAIGHCSLSAIAMVSLASVVYALPFNDDLVGGQLATGTVMRPKVPGTVPLGSLQEHVESREAALLLENPLKGDALSTMNGERLFQVNCAPCHGVYDADGKHTMGAVSSFLPGPDLTMDIYKTRTDGHIYGYIHFGGMAIMPAYGWKLSATEHWDIINYIRKIQAKK